MSTDTTTSSGGPEDTLDVRPASGHIGADIHGVDLAGPLDDTTVAGIRAALLRWKVVFFRGQRLDHAGQIAFAHRLGEPVRLRARGSVSPAAYPEIETTADRQELGRKHGMDQAEWLERRRHSTLRGWHADHTARPGLARLVV
ncbi:TauD/TfdA dioxygenase family protein, partial [Streptomyces scabiei]|uniref:TauD/TfdA dioxygenase family protein n=1 Tax=Streptomyces scabiei TaxID=1930 RepID=UPI0029B70D6D